MNLIKSVFAVSLIALPIYAKPVKIQCSDKTLEYDDQALKILQSNAIDSEIGQNQSWTGFATILNDNVIIKLPIDSTGFVFMKRLAMKTDEQLFAFIDSLDEQAFRLVSLYTQLIRERRISNVLKYKMFKNPKLQKLAEMPDSLIQNFVNSKFYLDWNQVLQRQETLLSKYFNTNPNDYQDYDKFTANSVYGFLVLIDFYQETLKKPLPLSTDHLKNVFNAFPSDIQKILRNKNLISIS